MHDDSPLQLSEFEEDGQFTYSFDSLNPGQEKTQISPYLLSLYELNHVNGPPISGIESIFESNLFLEFFFYGIFARILFVN